MRLSTLWVIGLFLLGWLVGCGSNTPTSVCTDNATCNNHGTCDDTGEKAVCTCETGYDASSDCRQCVSGYHEYSSACVIDTTCLATSCNTHGVCNDTSGAVVCTCDTGYDSSANCGSCSSGYHKENSICVADATCTDFTCNGHGTCDDQSGKAVCTCNENYDTLTNCRQCLGGYHLDGSICVKDEDCTDTTCNGHGSCVDAGETVSCTCDTGYDPAQLCGSCAANYTDYDSNGICLPSNPCAGDTNCSSQHQECVNNKGTPICGGCASGYHLENSVCVINQSCDGSNAACDNHGTCVDTGGIVRCINCESQYSGNNCETCTPICDTEICGTVDKCNVKCTKSNSTCTCASNTCTSAVSFCQNTIMLINCSSDGAGCYTASTKTCDSYGEVCRDGACRKKGK